MIFAGHSDPRTHMRYIERSAGLKQVPDAALPDFATRKGSAAAFSPEGIVENVARHRGFEPLAYGFGGRFGFAS